MKKKRDIHVLKKFKTNVKQNKKYIKIQKNMILLLNLAKNKSILIYKKFRKIFLQIQEKYKILNGRNIINIQTSNYK